MTKLICRDHGIECDFVVEGEEIQELIEEFGKHTFEKHGVQYSKEEVLHRFIMRQKRDWNESNIYP
ncbi:MAG: DUF1059 domain-containing protein [Nitrosopumilaceae archaeon]